jgi:hypothetical protein
MGSGLTSRAVGTRVRLDVRLGTDASCVGMGFVGRPSGPESKGLDGLGAADRDEPKGELESRRLMRLEGFFVVEAFADEEAYGKI